MSSGCSSVARCVLLSLLLPLFLPSCWPDRSDEPVGYYYEVFQVDSESDTADFSLTATEGYKIAILRAEMADPYPWEDKGIERPRKEQKVGSMAKITNTSSRSIKLAIQISGGYRKTEIDGASYEALGVEYGFTPLKKLHKAGKKDELLERWKRRREKSKYLAIELEPGEEYPVPWRIK